MWQLAIELKRSAQIKLLWGVMILNSIQVATKVKCVVYLHISETMPFVCARNV